MIKKIIGWLVLAILSAGSICGIVYGCKYHDLNTQYQSADDLRNSVDELNELTKSLKIQVSALEAKEEELTNQNISLSTQVEELELEVETLTAKKQELENQSVVDKENIANLENQIADKTSQIASLNETIAENNSRIATLTTEKENFSARVSELESQVAQLEADLESLGAENEDLIMRNELLLAEMTSLQNEITRLNGLMADYEDMKNQAFEVNFYVGDSIVHTDAIKSGNSVDELPSVDFVKYWKLADGTQIDPLTYTITANTNFYAENYKAVGYASTDGSGSAFVENGAGYLSYINSFSSGGCPFDYLPTSDSSSFISGVDVPEVFVIRILGYAELGSNGNDPSMPGSVSVKHLYASDELINNPYLHGSTTLNYLDYTPEIVKFTKIGSSYTSSNSKFTFDGSRVNVDLSDYKTYCLELLI